MSQKQVVSLEDENYPILKQKIKDQMKLKAVVTVNGDSTAEDALNLMRKYKIGSLAVVNSEGNFIGVITERDMIFKCDFKKKWHKAPISNLMTKKVQTLDVNSSLEDALSLISKKRFRHIPLLEDGKIKYMLSIKDLIPTIFELCGEDLIFLNSLHEKVAA